MMSWNTTSIIGVMLKPTSLLTARKGIRMSSILTGMMRRRFRP